MEMHAHYSYRSSSNPSTDWINYTCDHTEWCIRPHAPRLQILKMEMTQNRRQLFLVKILHDWWNFPLHTAISTALPTLCQSTLNPYSDLLTPCSTVLLQKLSGPQLVKKFPAFYGTRRFLTVFTNARHLSLSWVSSIQSTPPYPTSWRSILILSSLLCLGLPSCLFPQVYHQNPTYTSPLPHTCYILRPTHSSRFSPEQYWVRSADH